MDIQQQSQSKNMGNRRGLEQLDDGALLEKLRELLHEDHAIEAELLAHLGEVDHRRLYRERAHSSMFRFCVDELFLSESVAYKRITVARVTRTYPMLLGKVARGELHLTGLCLLAPHLTAENVEELTRAATHQSKRAIEQLLAERFPKPDVPDRVRKLPARAPTPSLPTSASSPSEAAASQPAGSKASSICDLPQPQNSAGAARSAPMQTAPAPSNGSAPMAQRAEVTPLSAERYKIQLTADAELCAKLREAQELLGPSVDRNDLATVFSKALDVLKKAAQPSTRSAPKSSARSRYIPRAVRRAAYERDGGQCAFVDSRGHRCVERSGLEYHHREAHGQGGSSTVENVELRCRCHNILAAEQDYGATKMAAFRRRGVREHPVRYRSSRGQVLAAGSGSRWGGHRYPSTRPRQNE
jgi:hypothetical protein